MKTSKKNKPTDQKRDFPFKPDDYTIKAQIFPGVLSATPLFGLWFFLLRETEWKDLLTYVAGLKFIGSVSLSVAFVYFYSQFIRMTSKIFQIRYFTSGRGFPSTYFMLYSDSAYSKDYKTKFRKHAKKILKLSLPNEEDEEAQPKEAQTRLDECFNHVRIKVGKGKLVFHHNVWYGFTRNLIGGAIYAIIFCLTNIIVGAFVLHEQTLTTFSCVIASISVLILIFNKPLLIQTSEAYAKQLISEFMMTEE